MPKREAGYVQITDPGSDKPLLLAATLQCCHCGQHWVPQAGSGQTRGYCARCNGYICGPKCIECVPIEAELEILEGTRDPTAVSVGGNLWLG